MTSSDEKQAAAHLLWYGSRQSVAANLAELRWKAVKVAASSDGLLSDGEREYLVARMVSQGVAGELVDAVLAWQPEGATIADLAAQMELAPESRRATGAWLIYNALCVALADGQLAGAEVEAARQVARTLEMEPQAVDALLNVALDEASSRKRRLDTFDRIAPPVSPAAPVSPDAAPASTPDAAPAPTPTE